MTIQLIFATKYPALNECSMYDIIYLTVLVRYVKIFFKKLTAKRYSTTDTKTLD